MLLPIHRLLKMPVMSLQTGVQLATTASVIIDPRKLQIVAFRVHGSRLSHENSVLHPEDIREISEIGLIVDDDSALMSTDGLVRLQEVIDFKFDLDGPRAENENGKFIGKVSSYAVDQDSLIVQQLYTKPSTLRSIVATGLTIHRKQIVSINNQRIVVKDPTVPVDEEKQLTRSGFINPFRSTNPLTTPPKS